MESNEQTVDRIAAEVMGKLEAPKEKEPRKYLGEIPSDKALDPSSETYEADKWARAHEKKRLAGYLMGKTYFSHGRVPAYPVGYRPRLWPVTPEQKPA